jgi:inorganic pyrophosphatase
MGADKRLSSRDKKFEIEAYQKPENLRELVKTHVSFSGSLLKHPYDSKRVILVIDPFSSNTSYYEFRRKDISFVEELPHIVNLEGEAITMVRIWVKKMSVGIRCSPFLVEEAKIP